MTNPFSTMSQTNKIIVGAVLAALVIFGGFATYFLVNQNQELRQQARVDGGTGGVVGVEEKMCPGGYANGYQACNPSGGDRSYKLCDNGTMRTFSCAEGQKCTGGRCDTATGTTETTNNGGTGGGGGGGTDNGGTGGGEQQDWSASAPCDSQDFRNKTGTTLPPGGKTCGKDLKTLYTCVSHGNSTPTVCPGTCMSGRCISATPTGCTVAGRTTPVPHGGTICAANNASILKCVDGTMVTDSTCSAAAGLTCATLDSETLVRCVNKNRVADGQCSPTTNAQTGCATGKGITLTPGSQVYGHSYTSCASHIICGPSPDDAIPGCSLVANSGAGATNCGGSGQAVCSSSSCTNAPVPCDSSSYIVSGGKCQAVQRNADGVCNVNTSNPLYGCVSNSAYKDTTCTLTGWRCGPKPATVTGNVSTLSSTRTTTSGNACATGTCTSSGTQCVAIHRCDALDENNHCTIGAPEVRRGTQSLNAQQIANESCKCVQLDVLSGANGTCDDGHIKNADYSTLLGAVQVCPNAQANCGGTGGAVASPTTETTTTTTTTTTTCGQSCNSTTLCPNNHSCSSGVCKLNACLVAGASCNANQCAVLSASPSPSPTLVCNSACTATSQCPQDHTCATNGKCQLTECVNGQACAADLCRLNRCGESCTANSDCPNNHQCSNNKCILNACATNPTLCSTDKCRVTQCGETCSTNADCPNDHTCNSGTCKLNACLVPGVSCNANKCAVTTTVAVLGCNQPCSSNPDCQAIDHICVDTADGKRCRLETNIASETCGGAVVAGPPTSLPVAGSADLLKAIGVGAFALVVGALGFFLL